MLALRPDVLRKLVDRQLPDQLPTRVEDREKEAVLVELRPEPRPLPGALRCASSDERLSAMIASHMEHCRAGVLPSVIGQQAPKSHCLCWFSNHHQNIENTKNQNKSKGIVQTRVSFVGCSPSDYKYSRHISENTSNFKNASKVQKIAVNFWKRWVKSEMKRRLELKKCLKNKLKLKIFRN